MGERTEPDQATTRAERTEEKLAHRADRPAAAEEEAAADRDIEQSDPEERRRVAEHAHEMNEIGAHTKGEGAVE
ncbi:MAG: hypothetical protein ACRDYE_00175 [Acidimicrobiales bacterium]